MTAGIGTLTVTFAGANASQPQPQIAVVSNSMTGTNPTVAVTQTTPGISAGTYAPYVDGASNGTQVARVILAYSCVADEVGAITLVGEHGQTHLNAPVYVGGGAIFRTQDLTGLDAAGVADMGAVVIHGDLTTGLLRF
jgi:hypothetical protein